MQRLRFSMFAAAVLAVCGVSLFVWAQQSSPVYFDLGNRLTEDFQGTYEFKYKHLEFVKKDDTGYSVRSSRDQSPSEDRIVVRDGRLFWILGHSNEQWIAFKTLFRRGDEWQHRLRGWNQHYRVVATDDTVAVPAGAFKNCAKIEVSWSADEPDMKGPQKVVYYLAPHLGIIKREVWSSGEKVHEEVLSRYESR